MKEVSRKIATSMTVEEYIQFELTSARHHEFVNGQLIEMPGEKAINNKIAGMIYIFLINHFLPRGYEIFNHDIKVASHDRTNIFTRTYLLQRKKRQRKTSI